MSKQSYAAALTLWDSAEWPAEARPFDAPSWGAVAEVLGTHKEPGDAQAEASRFNAAAIRSGGATGLWAVVVDQPEGEAVKVGDGIGSTCPIFAMA